jgi:hypothetical protein
MEAARLHADRPMNELTNMTKLIGAFNKNTSAYNNKFFGRHYHLDYVSVTM